MPIVQQLTKMQIAWSLPWPDNTQIFLWSACQPEPLTCIADIPILSQLSFLELALHWCGDLPLFLQVKVNPWLNGRETPKRLTPTARPRPLFPDSTVLTPSPSDLIVHIACFNPLLTVDSSLNNPNPVRGRFPHSDANLFKS